MHCLQQCTGEAPRKKPYQLRSRSCTWSEIKSGPFFHFVIIVVIFFHIFSYLFNVPGSSWFFDSLTFDLLPCWLLNPGNAAALFWWSVEPCGQKGAQLTRSLMLWARCAWEFGMVCRHTRLAMQCWMLLRRLLGLQPAVFQFAEYGCRLKLRNMWWSYAPMGHPEAIRACKIKGIWRKELTGIRTPTVQHFVSGGSPLGARRTAQFLPILLLVICFVNTCEHDCEVTICRF